jgi:hypothetical protein
LQFATNWGIRIGFKKRRASLYCLPIGEGLSDLLASRLKAYARIVAVIIHAHNILFLQQRGFEVSSA